MGGQAVIILDQAAFVINADVITQYCFSAFPVPVDSHAVQPEAALVIMRIIVLENGITRGSPIRIKGCPVIFEQTGTSHLIALNQASETAHTRCRQSAWYPPGFPAPLHSDRHFRLSEGKYS